MNAALTPVMEMISVPGQISGSAIISDMLNRIREKLERSCDLRQTDAYAGYSAEVEIKLQLRDVDTTEVHSQVNVGSIDPGQPVQRIALGGEVIAKADHSLERPVVPDQGTEASPSYARQRDPVSGRFLK